MKYFVDILKQFTQAQRLIVLVLLLSFTSGSYLVSQYLKTDDCRLLMDENMKMQNDFVKISEMLRAEQLRYRNNIVESSGSSTSDTVITLRRVTSLDGDTELQDAILKIAESNKK